MSAKFSSDVVEALQEREARFRTMLEGAFEGIAISRGGVVVEVNQRILDISGYTREDVIGRDVMEFVAEESREMVKERMESATEGRYDAVGLRKDGARLMFEVTSMNHVIRGHPVRLVALRDVTQQRRMEAHLRHSQKFEALGRLAAGVAHDFSNLLQVIRANCELLVPALAGVERGDALEILRAVESGRELTRQLLAFARHDRIEMQRVDLNAILASSELLMHRLLGGTAALVLQLASEPIVVRGDVNQIRQVLLNLATNARDAMPDGGTLTLATRIIDVADSELRGGCGARAGRYAVLTAVDTGVGMSEDVREHIFEPFFTTKDGQGTGLGLATIHSIVAASGGFIEVQSAPGEGSTFALYLPHADIV